MNKIIFSSFTSDGEKMKDFYLLSKDEFLKSYSYLTEEEYLLTLKKVNNESLFKERQPCFIFQRK